MKTTINKQDGRLKSLTLELDIIEIENHMRYMFDVLEKNIDIQQAPHNFEIFYTNLFRECEQATNTNHKELF